MATVGIFDSGVGGLTVHKAILERVPGLGTIYLGDTARVPYGSKSPEVVTQYSLRNTRFLVARQIDLLVVACNTASALALPALREQYAIPVLGVVEPGVRAAVRASRTGRVGVIGTPSTIASGAYQGALRAALPEGHVVAKACPLFVSLAEEGWTDPEDEVVRLIVQRYLAPLRDSRIDTLVLGCTHYPLLKRAIQLELPEVALVDSADAIATEVAERFRISEGESVPPRFYVTDTPDRFLKIAERFLGRPVHSAEQVDI